MKRVFVFSLSLSLPQFASSLCKYNRKKKDLIESFKLFCVGRRNLSERANFMLLNFAIEIMM